MIVRKKDLFIVSYMLLIAITIFSPERYGTTLKYVIIPLVLMLIFSQISIKLTAIRTIGLVFLFIIVISTISSDCLGVERFTPVFRSLCIMLIFFIILSNICIKECDMEKIKTCYIICVAISGVLALYSCGINGVNRYRFYFIWGLKDVNYFVAYMLPGCYLAIRRLVFEKYDKKIVNIICILTTCISILLLETRAAFITLIGMLVVMFIEYLVKDGLTGKKIMVIIGVCIMASLMTIWILFTPSFSRLTSIEGYGNNVRLFLWEEAMEAFYARPFIGSGLGVASYYSQKTMGLNSHNNYVDIIGDFGIMGISSFICLIIFIARVPYGKRLYMISYMISFLTPLAFINGFQTIVFWLPMILLSHENYILKNNY